MTASVLKLARSEHMEGSKERYLLAQNTEFVLVDSVLFNINICSNKQPVLLNLSRVWIYCNVRHRLAVPPARRHSLILPQGLQVARPALTASLAACLRLQ